MTRDEIQTRMQAIQVSLQALIDEQQKLSRELAGEIVIDLKSTTEADAAAKLKAAYELKAEADMELAASVEVSARK